MSIADVKENLSNLINSITKRYELIERQGSSKNLIDIDLAMEDIRLLYREMELLKRLTEANSLSESTSRHQRSYHEKVSVQTVPSSQRSNETPAVQTFGEQTPRTSPPVDENPSAGNFPAAETRVPVADFTPQPQQEKRPEPLWQHQPIVEEVRVPQQTYTPPVAVEKPVEPVYTPPPVEEPVKISPQVTSAPENTTPAVEPEKRKHIVGERFNSENNSIHERLAQIRDDKSIGARLQNKPVANIKDAIGLNEKFLFINELFSGDINAYNDAISNLNSRASMHEAFEMLNTLTNEFKWDGQRSAETIEKFAGLVQRRYM